MRLILFDIDGTLINAQGSGMRALRKAFQETTGLVFPDHVRPAGMTDPLIIREAFRSCAVAGSEWISLEERIWDLYPGYLEQEMTTICLRTGLLPGARQVVELLSQESGCRLGLLTGNLELTARLKLEPFGLNPYFPIGAYGSDCADRNRLPLIAVERANRHYGGEFRPEETWLVGDTPRDIQAALSSGSKILAVATGPYTTVELEEFLPHQVLASLDQPKTVVELLLA